MQVNVLLTLTASILLLSNTGCRSQRAATAIPQNRVESAMKTARAITVPGSVDYVSAVRVFVAEPQLQSDTNAAIERIRAISDRWNDPAFVSNSLQLYARAKRDITLYPDIVGGKPDYVTSDCVAIGTSDSWIGSGIFVSENVILTARHIVTGFDPTRVWDGPTIGSNGQELRLDKRRTQAHPDANVDLGIVVLAWPAAVRTRPRTTSAEASSATELIALGYGYTNPDGTGTVQQRNSAKMIITANPCRAIDQTNFDCRMGLEIVAGNSSTNTCHGDSGGPALMGDKLLGIVRAAIRQSGERCDMGSIFVRTAEQETWIQKMISENRPRGGPPDR